MLAKLLQDRCQRSCSLLRRQESNRAKLTYDRIDGSGNAGLPFLVCSTHTCVSQPATTTWRRSGGRRVITPGSAKPWLW